MQQCQELIINLPVDRNTLYRHNPFNTKARLEVRKGKRRHTNLPQGTINEILPLRSTDSCPRHYDLLAGRTGTRFTGIPRLPDQVPGVTLPLAAPRQRDPAPEKTAWRTPHSWISESWCSLLYSISNSASTEQPCFTQHITRRRGYETHTGTGNR